MKSILPAQANSDLLTNATKKQNKVVFVDKIFHKLEVSFCEYAKELWCKSVSEGKEILLTESTRLCKLDSLICVNWNNEQRHKCPTLKRLELGKIPNPKSEDQ